MQVKIRLMQQTDLPAVIALQDRCYSAALYEPPTLLSARLAVAKQSCWIAEMTAVEKIEACTTASLQAHKPAQHIPVLAYLFSYPSYFGKLSALASPFVIAEKPDLLYLHDMAVSEAARGTGVATALLTQAKQHAQHLSVRQLGLVAVQGSVGYWQRQGFSLQNALDDAAIRALSSYTGERAQYMVQSW
ncbi:GNAT family N-acetyltransferase [Alishewanella tabrizica]|uniref:N-acetyltransferase n=1 Tax=Alishewanella tabrizica TaxID=671278 RepID=A0ABQ2WCX6_9ALTE|nr:GNAT family N-acetyltransferase [Alishewanella tabrizica]GGW49491.1 N-acetyltransferase [Alishewanella tabrizica]